MKSTLMIGASALALILVTPGVALADQECGIPDASSDPNVASCVTDPGQFVNGITYNQGSYATPAGIKVDLFGTVGVAPTGNANAVTVNGSVDHAALIGARAGSRVTASGAGLRAVTSGTGAATVDSHGNVTAGTAGLLAITDLTGGTGLASALNQSDGRVTLNPPALPGVTYAIGARGGSANAVNNGTVTVANVASTGSAVYGVTGESHAAGGTLALTNSGSVTMSATAGALFGIASTASSGQVALANSGTLSLSNQAGSVTGFYVAGSGTAGATTLTNTGVLSVSTQNTGGGAHAVGMQADQGTSVALLSQRIGATGGFTVSGGAATGFLVNNASDAVSVTNSGVAVQVSGDTATGVRVTRGSSEAVRFADAMVGGTTYSGDLTVSSAGAATGVDLSGASDAVTVDFAGADLSVTSTGAGALGIGISGGTSVTITTAANAATGGSATLTVQAAGGAATGISAIGASGAETVTIGDAFTVANSAGTATGLVLGSGTTQSVSLAQGLSVSGSTATGAQLSGAADAVGLASAGAFTVQGGTGGATGLSMFNGTDQTATFDGAFSVSGTGGTITGVSTAFGSGALSITHHGSFDVANTGGEAVGFNLSGGSSQTVVLDQGAAITGTRATGAQILGSGSGASSLTSGGLFKVDGGTSSGFGIALVGGAGQSVSLAQGLTVTGNIAAGAELYAGTGAVSLDSQGAFVVDGGTGVATGLLLSGGTTQTVTLAQGLDVTGTGATGATLAGGTDAVRLTSSGAFTVGGGIGTATGVTLANGTSQDVLLAQGASVTGVSATGILSNSATGAVHIASQGSFAVDGTTGTATGVQVNGGTDQTVSLAQAATVTGIGATGVSMGGGSGQLGFTAADSFSIDGGTGGATGVSLSDGNGRIADFAKGAMVQANGGSAVGVIVTGPGGNSQVTSEGAFSVANSAGNAIGINLRSGADETVALAGLRVTGSTDGVGVIFSGTGALALASSQDFAVTGSDGDASGVSMSGGTQSATFDGAVNVTGADSASGVTQSLATSAIGMTAAGAFTVTGGAGGATGLTQSGGTMQTAQFDGDLTVTASGGNAYGVRQLGGIGTANLVTNAGLSVTNTGGAATGIDVVGADATTTIGHGLTVKGGAGETVGVDSNVTGTSAITVNGAVDVSNDPNAAVGTAIGIRANADTAQTVSVAGPVIVASQGLAVGFALSGGIAGTVDLTASHTILVRSSGDAAIGVTLQNGSDQSASIAGTLTVEANGAEAYGFVSAGATGGVTVTLGDAVSVTNATGNATAVRLNDGASQMLTANGAISADATGGDAYGVYLSDATGVATADLPAAVTATSDTGAAYGLYAINGAGLLIDGAGSVTATSGGAAYGVYSSGQTGAQDVTLGDVTAASTGGTAAGVVLGGSAAVSLTDAGTITAASAMGGAGVVLQTNGADAAIAAALNAVTTSGDNTLGVALLQTGGAGSSGTIDAAINAVATTGTDAAGVSAIGSESGAVTLTIGRIAQAAAGAQAPLAVASDHVGGITTQGSGAVGASLAVTNGAGALVNHGAIATTGDAAAGIVGASTGTGDITVDSWNVTTAGAGADGIAVTTGAGAQLIKAQTVTVSGAGSSGISALSDSGAITITASTIAAQQASGYAIGASSDTGAITLTSTNASANADAIHLASTAGTVRATLADGGTTSSATGAGLFVDTGGSATINVGTAATTASLHGATAGLSSHAAGGQSVVLSGTIGADNGLAVALSGGAATLVNKGVINGYMTLATDSLAFTNAGTWNASGGTSTFAAGATIANSGTINLFPAATAPVRFALTGVGSVQNSGTISLVNGHVGDVLDTDGASFAGSGNSRVVLEANLGGSAVNGSAPQTADLLVTGAASGVTTIAIKDLSDSQAAAFNFTGIRVVESASAAAGAFVLEGGSINKGFAEYQLVADGDGNLDLVSVPTVQAFELVRTGAEVRRYWRRSADAWSEQMRSFQPREGFSTWGQLHGGGETSKSRPTYTETVLGSPMTFTPDLDVRDSWAGGQLGFDWGKSDWSIGITGGYVSQNGRVKATGDRIKVDGGNAGLYARYQSPNGLFAHALAKVDRYSVKYALGGAASAPKFNGTSYGVDVEAGYHFRSGALFFEPALGLAWSHADLDGIRGAAGGFDASFDHVESAYGHAGLRAGLETRSGAWALKPYVGASWGGEMAGRPSMTLASGGTALNFLDTSEGGQARFEAGIQGASDHGLSAFAKVEGMTGEKSDGIGGRAGIALRW